MNSNMIITCVQIKGGTYLIKKMAAILVFFCLIANYLIWPPFQMKNSKEYFTLDEAKRANLQSTKRIHNYGNSVYEL